MTAPMMLSPPFQICGISEMSPSGPKYASGEVTTW